MPKMQAANDWKDIGNGLSYSQKLDLLYKEGQYYCKTSARHNGLIGPGLQLKDIIKKGNK